MSISGLLGTYGIGSYGLDYTGAKRKDAGLTALFDDQIDKKNNSGNPAISADDEPVTGGTISNSATANTLWQTQNIAQSSESAAIDVEEIDDKAGAKSAADQFKDFMNKTPEQLMREEILKELGYTEKGLEAMSPEERAKAEAKIKELVEQKVKEAMREKGIDTDVTAHANIDVTQMLLAA